jgi:HK97 family phage portal protein
MRAFQSKILDAYGKPITKLLDARALLGIDLPGSYGDKWMKQRKPNIKDYLDEYKGIAAAGINLNVNKEVHIGIGLYTKSNSDRKKWYAPQPVNNKQKQWLATKVRISDQDRVDELTNHPLLDLLDNPNPLMNGITFRTLTAQDKWIFGIAYWVVVRNVLGVPQQLHLLYPPQTHIIYDKSLGVPLYYEYGDNHQRYELDDVIKLIYIPNPSHPFEARAPLSFVWEELGIGSSMNATLAALLDNEGHPDMLISPKDDTGIGEDEAARMEHKFNVKYRRAGTGGAMVTEGDYNVSQLNYQPKDLAALKVHEQIRLSVLNALGIPFQMFAAAMGSQHEVAETVIETWISQAINPQLSLNASALNQLAKQYDSRLFVAYDDPSPVNREYELKKETELVKSGIKTRNEARAKYGYDALPGGDELPLPIGTGSSQTPTEPTPTEPTTEETPTVETDGGTPSTPAPEVTAGTSAESELLGKVGGIQGSIQILQSLSAGEISHDTAVGLFILFFHLSRDEAEALVGKPKEPKPIEPSKVPISEAKCRCVQKGHNKKLPKGEALAKCLKTFFRKQKAQVLNHLDNGQKAVKGLPSSFTLSEQWNRELFQESQPLVELMMKQGYEENAADLVARSGISESVFSVTNPHLTAQAKKLALHFCEETNATTSQELNKALEDLRGSLSEGLSEGERMTDLRKRVSDIFDSAEDYRSERIAQTEASRTHHEAQRITAKESGVVKGFQLLPSSACCELCQKVADEAGVIGLDDSFYTDKDAPEEYKERLVPIHPNCECTMLSVLDTDRDMGGN